MLIEENRLVIIAFVPRSGSNYLCDMLLRVGGLTTPMEYYYPYDFNERIIYWDTEKSTFVRINKEIVPNEIAWFFEILKRGGLKCAWDSHQKMIDETGGLLNKIKLQYIYLRRRDKLQQAISWYRADKNEQWTSKHIKKKDPQYDETEINKRLEYIDLDENRWAEYLKDKEYLEIFYEDLNYDTITQYEIFTGLKRGRDRSTDSDLKILRDELTEQWVNKYVKSHDSKCISDSIDGGC